MTLEEYYMFLSLEGEAADAELRAKMQEAQDSDAANEWGDQLWLNGEDPWSEGKSEQEAETEYLKDEEERAARAKTNRNKCHS